jgi:putative ABC transport system permease protein
VLGASATEVIILLTAEFGKWVLISNIIAWPVAYFLMNSWLKDFAYRINISFWVFAVAGILALLIALVTVSSHAFKAARSNPVNALKYE